LKHSLIPSSSLFIINKIILVFIRSLSVKNKSVVVLPPALVEIVDVSIVNDLGCKYSLSELNRKGYDLI